MIDIFLNDKKLNENVSAMTELLKFMSTEDVQELYYDQVQSDIGVDTRNELFKKMGVPTKQARLD